MKITVPTQILLDGVSHGAAVAASKSPKPVLECVALRADRKTGLSLEATDLDVGIRLHLEGAEVQEEGSLLVPAARLLAVVREIGTEETTLVEADGALAVDSEGSHFRIRGESVGDFVQLPYFPKDEALAIPGELLRDMVRRTVFATAREQGRYALHGVLFRVEGQALELVATDGRRLARVTGKLPKKAKRDLRVIVGPKGLSLLDRVMGQQATDVSVALEERQVLFRVGSALVISRLIDGTFPAYEDVIPKPSKKAFSIPASAFGDALRKASLLASREAMSVEFDIEPQLLTIRSRAPEVGEARVEVPIEYEGEKERLGFNPAFIAEALKVVPSEQPIRFEFSNSKAPGKMSDGPDYVYVVMPIALE